MRILYQQTRSSPECPESFLRIVGIGQCYFKQISFENDRKHITRKRHHHTGVEIHMIEKGYQVYEVEEECLRVEAGQYLLIPPNFRHCAMREDVETSKYSIFFCVEEGSPLMGAIRGVGAYALGEISRGMWDTVKDIYAEKKLCAPYSEALIGNRIFECLVHILRPFLTKDGLSEEVKEDEDPRLTLAKQYVSDNICRAFTVSELASYCYISPKQLTRLFESGEGMAVAEYIRKERCARIEEMLSGTSLSLCEISEAMNFNNEYYFNTFFKKYAGMTPGAYRRSLQKESK